MDEQILKVGGAMVSKKLAPLKEALMQKPTYSYLNSCSRELQKENKRLKETIAKFEVGLDPAAGQFTAADIDMALQLSRWAHDKDRKTPHDIGLTLLSVVTGYLDGSRAANKLRGYRKYEFCLDMDCNCLVDGRCSAMYDDACPYPAKEFHAWLQEHGFQIVKQEN